MARKRPGTLLAADDSLFGKRNEIDKAGASIEKENRAPETGSSTMAKDSASAVTASAGESGLFSSRKEEDALNKTSAGPSAPDNSEKAPSERASESVSKNPEPAQKTSVSDGAGSKEKKKSTGTSSARKSLKAKDSSLVPKRRLSENKLNIKACECTVWNGMISVTVQRMFLKRMSFDRTNRMELMNRIVECERAYIKANPSEDPLSTDIDTIVKNLEHKRDITEPVVKMAFNLLPENKDFIKENATACGMKMYYYVEQLIKAWC